MLWFAKLSFGRLAAMPDVDDVLAVFAGLPDVFVVVALVGTEVLWFVCCGLWPVCHQAVERIFGERVVILVGRSQNQTKRNPVSIANDAALCAELAAVNGAGACELPPKGAGTVAVSTICHSQSIPLRSS